MVFFLISDKPNLIGPNETKEKLDLAGYEIAALEKLKLHGTRPHPLAHSRYNGTSGQIEYNSIG